MFFYFVFHFLGWDVRHLEHDIIYWDIVVVTTLDNVQKDAYDALIQQRSTINRIPLGVDYLVITDPGKIGNGGSTMHAMHVLEQKYGWEVLRQKRILLIHAGGYSQRTPTTSCLGKIATSIPKGWPTYDLLDIKLALYSLFPGRMPHGGVFLCSSDTIELFDESHANTNWLLTDDFVAFAHPSSLTVGTQHGVFVLDPTDKKKCICVLQKPTIEQMKIHKAIWCHGEEEFVYTDSLFYFNMNVAQRLADVYRQEHNIQCEIDCYGDFMSALGICPLPRPVTKENDDNQQRTRIKQKIYDILLDCHLQVVILHKSSFNHTGTNDEYLDICCGIGKTGQEIFEELKLEKHVGCKVFDEGRHDTIDFWHGILPALPHGDTLHHQPSAPDVYGCVIHSFIHPKCRSSKRSLFEYCCIGVPMQIGDNTILSNITLVTYSDFNQTILHLPSNLIMQTIPLNNELFATFAFGFHDNMKITHNNLDKILYFGQPVSTLAGRIHRTIDDLFDDENNRSLWTLKIFPVTRDPNESFEKTLNLIISNDFTMSEKQYVSIQEILKRRDISSAIQYRSNLINCT
ncbi:unnamed protein product [Rotaria magnacalcarata]|uniref:GDP-fucose pyrophosphorylase domain-containing protein n=5 Tax=Rotaria magnacalcarata TaxID=392030 RepID=A0A816YX04_9BILA|nr:unnamed protein product [Rotaria magnacalcarata]CAF2165273.1 unnamed protein product [Rotaria magnacalcarata]CAF2197628.1 unnamed protein product [Rotaria magnacalcarata]